MDLLQQLLLCVGAFALIVVVGTFVGLMMIVVGDVAKEREQAKSRDRHKTNRE